MPVYSIADMPTIGAFMDSDAFIRGLMGPYGSGKSSACVMEIFQRGMKQGRSPDGVRRSRFAVIRNTAKQLEDTTERTFLQWAPPHQFGDWTPSKHNYTIRALRGQGDDRNAEIDVMFRALDRPDQIGDLLSMELTGAWLNEGREIPWAIFDAVTGRVGRYPAKRDGGATWSGIFSDTNPPDVDSEWFKFFEEMDHSEKIEELAKVMPGMTVEKFVRIFKQPSGLSPQAENLRNLPDAYYQRQAVGKSPEWIKVYIHGEYGFTTDGKAVWPEYNDALHCPTDKEKWPKPILSLPIVRSYDFGLTPACVFSQVTPRGQWIVFDELIATSMGANAFSDEVIEHSARYYNKAEFWDVGDPAGMQRSQTDETTCFQILRGKGIEIEPAMQSLEIRLESVRKPLRTLVDGRPQFVIHPRCAKLRRGLMGGYHFRRMRISGERYTNSPEKDSYCVPMSTEALTPLGWKRPDELRDGHPIYGFDVSLQRLVPTEVERVNIFPGEHDVIAWRGDFSSFISTGAHRNIVRHKTGDIRIVPTVDLNTAHSLICAASEDRPRKQQPFSDEFIALAAWVAAEGTYRLDNDAILLCQSRSHNPAYCEYLERLVGSFHGTIMHDAEERLNPKMQTWRIVKETAWLLRYWMPNKCPSPEFIARMSNVNRRLFVYEFIRGDGHAGGPLPNPGLLSRAREFMPNHVTPRISQKRRDVIDALQMMATLSGLRTHLRNIRENERPIHHLTVLSQHPFLGLARKNRVRETSNGVWCPTTATGSWVCRQDGQTFITGNSHVCDALGYAGTRLFGAALYVPKGNDNHREYESVGRRSSVTGY
jgi:hypothetical protein